MQAYSKSLHVASVDYSDPSWFDIISSHAPFDVVVSGFSIHHQPDPVKRQVYADIFDLLEPGGVFVNVEHVSSATAHVEALYDDYFIDSLWASQLTERGAKTRDKVAAAYHKRTDKQANILAAAELHCEWLRSIGYQDVDCFFKVSNWPSSVADARRKATRNRTDHSIHAPAFGPLDRLKLGDPLRG